MMKISCRDVQLGEAVVDAPPVAPLLAADNATSRFIFVPAGGTTWEDDTLAGWIAKIVKVDKKGKAEVKFQKGTFIWPLTHLQLHFKPVN